MPPISRSCPFPCGLFVAQTAGDGERPGKGAILCESCHVDIAPKTMYWPRTDDGGMRCYNHVNASQCLPKSADAGKCGGCGTAADSRFVIGPLGCSDSDKVSLPLTTISPCFPSPSSGPRPVLPPSFPRLTVSCVSTVISISSRILVRF